MDDKNKRPGDAKHWEVRNSESLSEVKKKKKEKMFVEKYVLLFRKHKKSGIYSDR